MVDRAKFAAQSKSYMSLDMYAPNDGEVLTIRDVKEVTITPQTGAPFKKLQLWWVEERPALDLNPSMLAFLIGSFGPDDDAWIRKKVFVFHDPTIRTKRGMGGLVLDTPRMETRPTRASAEKAGPDPALRAALNPKPEMDDDIPF